MHESQKLPFYFIVGFIAFSLMFGLGVNQVSSLPEKQAVKGRWVNHTHEVLEQLDNLALHTTEAETGQRGYLLTGDEAYLDPYKQSLVLIEHDLNEIQNLTSDNLTQQNRLPALRTSISDKLEELSQTIGLRKDHSDKAALDAERNNDAALKLVGSGRGQQDMTDIQQKITDMKSEEESLLKNRVDNWDAALSKNRTFALISGFFMYVLVCVALFCAIKLSRQRHRLAEAERIAVDIQRIEAERLSQIVHMQRDIAGHTEDLPAAMQNITERVLTLIKAEGAIVELLEDDEVVYKAASGTAAPYIGTRLKVLGSLSGQCITNNTVMNCIDSEMDKRVDREVCRKIGLRSMIVTPLHYNTKAIGVLKVLSSKPEVFNDEDVSMLQLIAGGLSATLSDALFTSELQTANLKLEAANSNLEKLATQDGLTGLKNHRTFQETLAAEFNRARRYKKQLSIILIDVDYFKKFNDTYGHQAGDEVLKRVAAILTKSARSHDMVARYGGEEFVLLLPETDAIGAKILADRILRAIPSGIVWEKTQVTVSIGLSSMDGEFTTHAELLKAADAAMYNSKNNGRNCISSHKPIE